MKKTLFYSPISEKLKSLNFPKERAAMQLPSSSQVDVKNPIIPLKNTFSNFSDLVFQLVDKAVLSTFANVKIEKKQSLILFSWVIPSGLGDLSMQIHIANIIHKKIPHLDLQLVTVVEQQAKIPKSLTSPLPHHFVYYSHPKEATFTSSILKLMQKAFCILEIPTPYFGMDRLQKQLQKSAPCPEFIRVGEYGFIDTDEYNPSTRNRSMGLHFLEKGIVTLDPMKEQKRDLNTYFAYLIKIPGVLTYLYTILLSRNKDKEDLKIIVPNLDRIVQAITEIDFTQLNVQSITIDDKENSSTKKVQNSGKNITFIQQKNLSQKDVMHLMNTSNPFVGVRGDGSFTECFATNSLFFYDALDHAIPFLQDLLHLVRNHLYPYFSLYNFIDMQIKKQMDPKKRAETICECLADPNLAIGMKKLHDLIREKYSFNDPLIWIIKQAYTYHKEPTLKEAFNKKLGQYCEKKITLKTLLSR